MPIDFDRIINRRHTNSIKWTFFDEDVVPMWVADMDFPAPEPIITALHTAVEHGIFGYELPNQALRESVAARMKKLYGWKVDEKSVVPVTGLVSGFYAAASALCQPGDGYLIQTPVYMPFNDIQKNLGVIRQEAQLIKTGKNGRLSYAIDWDGFEKAFNAGGSKTKMFLLCNPHNPTGQTYSREELSKMAELCLKNNTVIVSDEIHSELMLGSAKHVPMGSLSPEIAQQTITLVAPSKTFNIAGLFCGFAIIPNEELRERYKAVVERMTLHVASLAQVAAQAAFSGQCDGWLAELRAYLTANRDFAVGFVENELSGVQISVPDATYLAWLDCNELVASGKIKTSPYEFFLKEARVALNDGAAFGTGGKNFVRLNFGCPREILVEGLERMKKALTQK
ncbi:MAG: pyridoxal phosphate-dependent aminotransferase [Chloroflexi bacterium]|nr:pyridoxal phosphate-dependent aminotransferase [Chloroflexota bacterium]